MQTLHARTFFFSDPYTIPSLRISDTVTIDANHGPVSSAVELLANPGQYYERTLQYAVNTSGHECATYDTIPDLLADLAGASYPEHACGYTMQIFNDGASHIILTIYYRP